MTVVARMLREAETANGGLVHDGETLTCERIKAAVDQGRAKSHTKRSPATSMTSRVPSDEIRGDV